MLGNKHAWCLTILNSFLPTPALSVQRVHATCGARQLLLETSRTASGSWLGFPNSGFRFSILRCLALGFRLFNLGARLSPPSRPLPDFRLLPFDALTLWRRGQFVSRISGNWLPGGWPIDFADAGLVFADSSLRSLALANAFC